MKLLLFLSLLCSMTAVAQDTVKTFSGTGFGDRKTGIMIYDDGRMEIKGDSLSVIKLLLKVIRQDMEREVALLLFKKSLQSFVIRIPLTKSQQTHFLQLVADFERKRYGPDK
jgi:hypothetical protein